MPTDEWAIKLLTLLIELLRSGELPELATAGAWYCAQMWLRVDRKGGQPGAIDNMGDRPLTLDRWAEAVIELDVLVLG